MIKYAIRLQKNKRDAVLIFHAAPNSNGYFQWYITEHKNVVGQPIEDELHES
ncbi:hypothetical protein [Priestia megaterium]